LNEQVFKPANELTFSTVQHDSVRLQKILASERIHLLWLDLSHVEYCDSAGLAFLIEAKRLCIQSHIILEIKHVPQVICRLAKFCGVEDMISSTVQSPVITEVCVGA
jgi:phospholipid transport system transporter-binding protein